MTEAWTQSLQSDRGWGRSAFDGADQVTPFRNKILKTKLIDQGLVCMSDGNIYIFHTALNIWIIFCSSDAVTFVNNILGMESASVKYTDAFVPYVRQLERDASDRMANDVPQSVCIGTSRLRVSIIPGGLQLSECEAVLPLPPGKEMLQQLCYMSMNIRYWPKTWQRSPDYLMYRFLSPLFVDPIELKTAEWAIGHALLDPHSYSKTIILYGEGGHGKSTFLNALNAILMGCCGTIDSSELVGLNAGISFKIAAIIASNRVVAAGDVGGPNRNTNLTVIKTLTGHDYIPLPPSRVKTACTLFYATNMLDDPQSNPEWLTPAIMRRVAVILMNARIMEDFSGKIPYDPISRLDFALRCIHTRMANPDMPISAMSVVLTLTGSRFESIAKYIAYADDATEEDCITATAIIAGCIGIETHRVGELAKRISKSAVVDIGGILYIKDIIPSDH